MSTFSDATTFSRGEIDPRFTDRVDADFRRAAVARMVNWQPDLAGPAIKRPTTWDLLGGYTVASSGNGLDAFEFEFRGDRFLVYVAFRPSGGDPRIEVSAYGPVALQEDEGEDGITYRRYVLPETAEFTKSFDAIDLLGESVNRYYDYVRIGPAVFIVSQFFPPHRIFLDGNGDLQMEQVVFYEEVIGTVTPDPGTANWTGVDSVFESQLQSGDIVKFSGREYEVDTVTDDENFTTTTNYAGVQKSDRLQKKVEEQEVSGTGTITVDFASGVYDGTGTAFTSEVSVGDIIVVNGYSREVIEVVNDEELRVEVVTPYPKVLIFNAPYTIVTQSLFAGQRPRRVTAYQSRLVFASSIGAPTRVWVSAPNDVFLIGANSAQDDSPINVELLADGLDDIQWLVGSDRLYIGSAFGEYSVGAPDTAITPGNFGLRKIGTTGSSDVPPAISNSRIYYLNRTRGQIWAVQFSFDTQSFVQTDLASLAPHLVADGVRAMAVQEATNADRMERLYVVTDKNELRVCSLSFENNVLAWNRADVSGMDVGFVTAGVQAPYFSLFNPNTGDVQTIKEDDTGANLQLPVALDIARYIDAASVEGDAPSAVSVDLRGFLQGETVAVYSTLLGYLGQIEASGPGGAFIDLSGVAASFAQVGEVVLGLPIQARMTMLGGTDILGGRRKGGSGLNRRRRLVRAVVSAHQTRELRLSDYTVLTPPLADSELHRTGQSGRFETRFLGWDKDDALTIDAPDYSPATVRSVTREYSS